MARVGAEIQISKFLMRNCDYFITHQIKHVFSVQLRREIISEKSLVQ